MFKPPEPANLDLNLAPMVDVMMCLIIFFLLASKLVQAENYELELPWAVAAQEVEKTELGNRLTVNVVRESESIDLPPRYIMVEWDAQRQEIVQTPRPIDAIQTLMQQRMAQAVAEGSELRCVIRADEDCTYADVEAVLRAAGSAKIAQIIFAANQGEQPQAGN
jgi:biopolymer transport protein ExbD